MKILYGVVGEGMGHATRSHVVLEHLRKEHEVMVVASGKAHQFLRDFHPNIVEIGGYGFAYEDGKVDAWGTLKKILGEIPSKAPQNVRKFLELSKSFKPDAVISDFESFAYTFGKLHNIPVISIDNMQVINRCRLDVDVPAAMINDYLLAKGVVMGKLPGCYHYMITTFFDAEVVKPDTTLYPPILRKEVLDAERMKGDHVLVYLTSSTGEAALETLQEVDAEFVVYGLRRDEALSNVVLKDFSATGFVEDLASSRAVVATAGYSLISEAVYLRKPYLALPLAGQFEQLLNGMYLRKLGYGDYAMELTVEVLNGFLGNLNRYEKALAGHTQDGNREILSALDGLLEKIGNERENR